MFSSWLPFVSDVKLSVDDELLTIVYLLSGRFFGLFRTWTVCVDCGFGLLKWFGSFCKKSVELVLVGEAIIGAVKTPRKKNRSFHCSLHISKKWTIFWMWHIKYLLATVFVHASVCWPFCKVALLLNCLFHRTKGSHKDHPNRWTAAFVPCDCRIMAKIDWHPFFRWKNYIEVKKTQML